MSLNRWSQTTVGKKLYFTILFVFTMVACTSCSTGGGNAPNPQTDSGGVIEFHGAGPLQLSEGDLDFDGIPDDGFLVLNRRSTPNWVVRPVNSQFKFSLLFNFNHEIDESTLVSGQTFQLKLGGRVADGSFQFSPGGSSAVFYTNKPSNEIFPLGAGDDLPVFIKIKGARGPVTDRNGNIWPFNGVYKVPEVESGPAAPIGPVFNNEDLLDGDRDGVPGGDFVRDFHITG